MSSSSPNLIHSTVVLESKTTRGNIKYWQAHIDQKDDNYFTYTTYWQQTKDGTNSLIQSSVPTLVKGKNIGRSNETSDKQQAFLELESLFKKQIEREGYYENGKKSSRFPAPMLAQVYSDHREKIDWTYGNYAQSKKDGCRILIEQSLGAWSRKGVAFIPEVTELFLFDTAGYVLDGELMLPSNYSQQQLMSACKKKGELTPYLEFHVFDLIDYELAFPERLVLLNEILKEAPKNLRIKLLETRFVANEAEFLKAHSEWSSNGDEGSILRDGSSGYKAGRSRSLLKHKDFVDEEFLVIDIVEGKGKFEGMAMFRCALPNGTLFDVTPKGSMGLKAELFKNRSEYIGESLTVKFQKYSDSGIPIFPVGIKIRDRNLEG